LLPCCGLDFSRRWELSLGEFGPSRPLTEADWNLFPSSSTTPSLFFFTLIVSYDVFLDSLPAFHYRPPPNLLPCPFSSPVNPCFFLSFSVEFFSLSGISYLLVLFRRIPIRLSGSPLRPTSSSLFRQPFFPSPQAFLPLTPLNNLSGRIGIPQHLCALSLKRDTPQFSFEARHLTFLSVSFLALDPFPLHPAPLSPPFHDNRMFSCSSAILLVNKRYTALFFSYHCPLFSSWFFSLPRSPVLPVCSPHSLTGNADFVDPPSPPRPPSFLYRVLPFSACRRFSDKVGLSSKRFLPTLTYRYLWTQ